MKNYWTDEAEHDARCVWLSVVETIENGTTFDSLRYHRDGERILVYGIARTPVHQTLYVYSDTNKR